MFFFSRRCTCPIDAFTVAVNNACFQAVHMWGATAAFYNSFPIPCWRAGSGAHCWTGVLAILDFFAAIMAVRVFRSPAMVVLAAAPYASQMLLAINMGTRKFFSRTMIGRSPLHAPFSAIYTSAMHRANGDAHLPPYGRAVFTTTAIRHGLHIAPSKG